MKYSLLITLTFTIFSFGKTKSLALSEYNINRKVFVKTIPSVPKDLALSSVSLKVIHKSSNNIGFSMKALVSTRNINTKLFQTSEPFYNRFSIQQNAKANSRFQKINLNSFEIIARSKKYQNKIYINLFKK